MTQNPDFLLCAFEGCDHPRQVGELCSGHAAQVRQGRKEQPLGLARNKPEGVCSVEGCHNIQWSGGACRGHYLRAYHGKPLGEVKQVAWTPCREKGCVRGAVTKGLCSTHYQASLGSKRRCSVTGCDRPHDAKGYCKAHWAQAKRGRTPGPIRDWGTYSHAEPPKCAVDSCTKPAVTNGMCGSHNRAATNFNLNSEQLSELFAPGCCAACGGTQRLSIDHDHACCSDSGSCGKCVRGLLCAWCNTALGQVGDSVERLELLIAYLRR